MEALGGTLTRMNLPGLPEAELVVNCAGLGARLMAADRSVVPVRGQVLAGRAGRAGALVARRRRADVRRAALARHRRRRHRRRGRLEPDPVPETARAILARATRLVPELEGAKVLRHKVGLRPVRPAVRVERQGSVVHCYGHGGAGVTLSWGTADEVVGLVASE